ncbi:MAG: SHOCT domain-containing protein [Natronomonas sp.]
MRSRDFQERIDAAREEGWRVVEDDDERVVMKRPSYGSRVGHLLVGAATVWWSFGLGNLVYAVYEYFQHTDYQVLYSETTDEDPMETLRRRYARGEIDEAELERRAGELAETDPKLEETGRLDRVRDRVEERIR